MHLADKFKNLLRLQLPQDRPISPPEGNAALHDTCEAFHDSLIITDDWPEQRTWMALFDDHSLFVMKRLGKEASEANPAEIKISVFDEEPTLLHITIVTRACKRYGDASDAAPMPLRLLLVQYIMETKE